MSGRARRKAVSRYVKYLRPWRSVKSAKRYARMIRGYSRLAKDLSKENCLLKHLEKRYPQGLRPYPFSGNVISEPLVWKEGEQ